MRKELTYEEQKRARRRLRGQQRSLRYAFLQGIQNLSDKRSWESLSSRFSEALARDAQLDPQWIDTDRYPVVLYNLFSSLGFAVR